VKPEDLSKFLKLLGEEAIGAKIKPKDLGNDINDEVNLFFSQ
jgi:hypothetical protein